MADEKYFYFEDDGAIPNNPSLPVILYPAVFQDDPEKIETVFNRNEWTNSWVGGVFDYHHYHSNTHEVLGVRSGTAILQLGGEQGSQLKVETGDVAVLPAGTGHKKIDSSADFEVVGAYPGGVQPNKKTGNSEERPYVLEDIQNTPLPHNDPIYGKKGPLLTSWS